MTNRAVGLAISPMRAREISLVKGLKRFSDLTSATARCEQIIQQGTQGRVIKLLYVVT